MMTRTVCVSKCFNSLDPDAGDGPGALELQPAGVPQAIGSASAGQHESLLAPVSSLCGAPAMLDA